MYKKYADIFMEGRARMSSFFFVSKYGVVDAEEANRYNRSKEQIK